MVLTDSRSRMIMERRLNCVGLPAMSVTQVVAIIPALNEALNLPHVLAGIPRDEVQQIIVVDNGSSDGTPEVAARAGATVISEPRRGYGYAPAVGIAAAPEASIYVFLARTAATIRWRYLAAATHLRGRG